MDTKASIYLLSSGVLNQEEFLPYRHVIHQFYDQGEFLSFEHQSEMLSCYQSDSQQLHTRRPLVVFKPHSAAVIAAFVQACCQEAIPLAIRCGGTGLMGGCVPPQKGILLLTGHLRQILHYDSQTGQATVEPGITPKQLSQRGFQEGWECPLEMAANGVAGLAGCLSTSARGYHQSLHTLNTFFQWVDIIDGEGNEHRMPARFVCGAEGMLGVIIRLHVQLSRIPQMRLEGQFCSEWDSMQDQWDWFKAQSSLISLTWDGRQCCVVLAGEEWRVQAAWQQWQERFKSIKRVAKATNLHFGLGVLNLSHAVPLYHMASLLHELKALCETLSLSFTFVINMLEEALHIQITHLKQTSDHFLVPWINLLEKHGAMLISHYGVGAVLAPYLPPFYQEGELACLKQLHQAFDPRQIMLRQRFFPVPGKSLEKIVL